MKNLLKDVGELDGLIRQLRKNDSRMRAGQWIDAWRENLRIIAQIERNKEELLRSAEINVTGVDKQKQDIGEK